MVNVIHDFIRIGNDSDERIKRWVQDTHDIDERDGEGQSPLHLAAFQNLEKTTKLLLKKGANCNALDSKGWTPLHCAASSFNFSICQLILTYGKPNVNILTPSGASALSYICRTIGDEINQVKTIKMILKEGAEIDISNKFGETALHQACLKGSLGAVKCLIENGANVNIQTNTEKETPIHYAVRSLRCDVVECLARNGAEINVADINGKTAIDKAFEANNPELESTFNRLKREQVPWKEIKPNGKWPIPRCKHSSSVYNNRWYMYGGCDNFQSSNKIFHDLFMFNAITVEWRALKPFGDVHPPPLYSHTTVIMGKTFYLFGGVDADKSYNDLYALDTELMTWSKVAISSHYLIRPRGGHTMNVISDTTFVVFGGRSENDYFNDIHTFNIETNVWERITSTNKQMAPSKRYQHTSSLVGDLLYIFGGTDGINNFNDVHILDLKRWEWLKPEVRGTIPYERYGHSAVVINSVILIYGGQDPDGEILNDIFAFDTTSFTWIEYDISMTNHRIDRAGHSMAILNYSVYTFGGNSLFVLHELLPQILETQAKEIPKAVTKKKKQVVKPPLPNRPISVRKDSTLPPFESNKLLLDILQKEVKLLIGTIKEQYGAIDPQSAVGLKISSIEHLLLPSSNNNINLNSLTLSQERGVGGGQSPQLPPKPSPRVKSESDVFIKPEKPPLPSKLGAPSSTNSLPVLNPPLELPVLNPPMMLNLPVLNPPSNNAPKPSPPPKPINSPLSPHNNNNNNNINIQPAVPPKPLNHSFQKVEDGNEENQPRSRAQSLNQHSNRLSQQLPLGSVEDFGTYRIIRDAASRPPSLMIKKDGDDEIKVQLQNIPQSHPERSSKRESIRPAPIEKYVLPPRSENSTQYYLQLFDRIPKRDFKPDFAEIKDKKLRFRAEVFNELLETELAYLKDLCVIIGLYKKPLENEYAGCVMKHYIDTIFINVEELFEINLQLYSELLKIEKIPLSQQNIGIAFLTAISGLAKYNHYCSNQDEATETIKKLEKSNDPFSEFLAVLF